MFNLKSHTGNEKRKADFYILNKGMNAGKPMLEPCPNCFEVFLNNKHDKDHLFYITLSLWKTKKFEQSLIGSVIPYIRKKELENIMHQGIKSLHQNQTITTNIKKINNVDRLQIHLELQIKKLNELKFALMHELLK
jgi:hypothetical protein